MDAVELHDTNAGAFRKRYDDKDSFKDRLSIWIQLFNTYFQANSSVIELGCGPGLMAKEIIAMGNQLHAIDGSEKMIEKAKQEVGPSDKIQFTESYISKEFLSHFPSANYDHAVSSSVLEYIKEAGDVIEEVNRILKPGGTFIFSIPNKQSLFRITETITYRLFGKPGYRKYLHTLLSEADILQLDGKGWKVEQIIFQGHVPYYSAITSFLPNKYQKPMMIVILRKK